MQQAPINSNHSHLSNSLSKFANQLDNEIKSKVEFI